MHECARTHNTHTHMESRVKSQDHVNSAEKVFDKIQHLFMVKSRRD